MLLDLVIYIPVSSPWLILLFSQKDKNKKNHFPQDIASNLQGLWTIRTKKTKIENVVRQSQVEPF